MRRCTERAVGVALLTTVALGTTACETRPPNRFAPVVSHTAVEPSTYKNFNGRLQAIAAKILTGYHTYHHPVSFETKPPDSVGFGVQLNGGANLAFEFQSPTNTPDPQKTEMVDIQETRGGKRIFDIQFYTRTDGKLNASCESGSEAGVNIVGQLSVQSKPRGFNGNSSVIADTLTAAMLRQADAFVNLAATAHNDQVDHAEVLGICEPLVN